MGTDDRTPHPHPEANRDYPRSYREFLAWFPDDEACVDYLDWLRWPDGFICPRCTGKVAWRLADRRWWCESCRRRVSATAGTIFHRSHTPLTVWFAAAWHLSAGKNGVSAKTLHRILGFGSYPTAWAMLHRYRSAMVRPGRDRLSGTVEVDESMIGGTRPGKRGRGAAGKVLTAIAIERGGSRGFGRCRIAVIPNAEAESLRAFLLAHVEPGSILLTDGLASYPAAAGQDYTLRARPIKGSGLKAHAVLPGVHLVASLVKRWLLGTHQGAVEEDHLQAYLDEFTFRFNRRKSRARGMLFYRLLQQAVGTGPISFTEIVANPSPRPEGQKATRPTGPRSSPPSLRVEMPPHP
jgi:transposase-like protein